MIFNLFMLMALAGLLIAIYSLGKDLVILENKYDALNSKQHDLHEMMTEEVLNVGSLLVQKKNELKKDIKFVADELMFLKAEQQDAKVKPLKRKR